ncbi:hypothetical protein [Clostridium felsineum]|uniref:hypothetical protein n=1 Tax=Clostridium felsineum TaxID=36839 RepID=UPI00098C9111|nr:hypothetical protein [Clostridium felsineum]URZ18524.1 hypothetical protein CLFE_046120 [Clostridium felsineum DSM 794]
MAIKVIRKGNVRVNNDHNLLFNRGLANQHPIESIVNLKDELASKYVKPNAGIPKTDLDFLVVTQDDLHESENQINGKIVIIDDNILGAQKDIQGIKDLISQYFKNGTNGTLDNATIDFTYRQGFREEYVSENKDIDFYLTNTFIADNKHLKVYRDGTLLIPDIDYIEISNNHIQMSYPLEANIFLSFICENLATVFSPIHEEIISIENQKDFTLKNQYTLGDNSLSIYVHGLRLECNTDYKEVSNSQITLLKDPYAAGTKLIFRQELVESSGQILYHEKDYSQKTFKLQYTALKDQSQFTLSEAYIPGANMLMVTVQGLLMWLGNDFDYMEVDSNHIQFNYPLEEGDKVVVTCTSALFNWSEKFVTVENQTLFNFSNTFCVGKDDLIVYENGIQLIVDDDYLELSNNAIQLVEAPPTGSKLTIYKRR